jgi:NAD(P)-dependent dehydrogenase (short-subunit alcohol dehydrogenase family)
LFLQAFGNIIPVQADITDNKSLLALVAKIEADEGYINLLINNAGTMMNEIQNPVPKGDIKALQSALWNAGTPEDFDKTYKLNVTATYYTSVSFLHLLHEGNKRTVSRGISSQIITISSVAAFRRDEAVKSISYNTSKAAVNLLGKLLTNLLRDYNIRSNIICPGIFPSGKSTKYAECYRTQFTIVPTLDISATFKVTPETVAKMVPLGRTGNLDDMGGLILFMASKAGAYVNGGVQLNDGGRLSMFPSTW